MVSLTKIFGILVVGAVIFALGLIALGVIVNIIMGGFGIESFGTNKKNESWPALPPCKLAKEDETFYVRYWGWDGENHGWAFSSMIEKNFDEGSYFSKKYPEEYQKIKNYTERLKAKGVNLSEEPVQKRLSKSELPLAEDYPASLYFYNGENMPPLIKERDSLGYVACATIIPLVGTKRAKDYFGEISEEIEDACDVSWETKPEKIKARYGLFPDIIYRAFNLTSEPEKDMFIPYFRCYNNTLCWLEITFVRTEKKRDHVKSYSDLEEIIWNSNEFRKPPHLPEGYLYYGEIGNYELVGFWYVISCVQPDGTEVDMFPLTKEKVKLPCSIVKFSKMESGCKVEK